MKILIIHDYGVEIGGAETVVAESKRSLVEMGHEVRVVASQPDTGAADFSDYEFVRPSGSKIERSIQLLYNQSAVDALGHAIADFRPDILHYHTITEASPAVLRYAKQLPSVMTVHDYGLLYPRLSKALRRSEYCGVGDGACCMTHAGLARYLFERVRTASIAWRLSNLDMVVTPSHYLANVFERVTGIGAQVIPNGTGDTSQTSMKGIGALFVGRLESEKGVTQLVEAYELSTRAGLKSPLTIVGDGSMRLQLQLQVDRLGLHDLVTFSGAVPRDQMAAVYAKHAYLICPSLWPEPFGLIGPEAMSCGLPVIASTRGGMGEWLVDAVNGLAVDPDDIQGLSAAISRLSSNRELFENLSAGARRTSQDFTISSHAQRLATVYEQICEQSLAEAKARTLRA